MMRVWHNRRFLTLLSIVVVAIAGLGSKFYSGPARSWFNNSLGGAIYEIFWCLFFFGLFPRKKAIAPICVGVFGATSLLEGLQLWKTPVLEVLRSHLLGRLLLGTTFVGSDFFYYAIALFFLEPTLKWSDLKMKHTPLNGYYLSFHQHELERLNDVLSA
jgi:hypothetical protein